MPRRLGTVHIASAVVVPYACAIVNGLAALALATVLAPGVSLAPVPASAAYVAGHLVAWRLGWALWIAAALSVLPFFWWWAARLRSPPVPRLALARPPAAGP